MWNTVVRDIRPASIIQSTWEFIWSVIVSCVQNVNVWKEINLDVAIFTYVFTSKERKAFAPTDFSVDFIYANRK